MMIGGDVGHCTYRRDEWQRFPCVENRWDSMGRLLLHNMTQPNASRRVIP